MKPRDFAELLIECGSVSKGIDQEAIANLAKLFASLPGANLKSALTKLRGLQVPACNGRSVGHVYSDLKPILSLLGKHAKPPVLADLSLFREWASNNVNSVVSYQAALDDTDETILISRYRALLDDALYDDAKFAGIVARMKNDPNVTKSVAMELSRQLYGEPGATKAAAIKNIAKVRMSLADQKRRGDFNAGRTAA